MTQTIIAGLQQLSAYIYLITDIFLIILVAIFLLAFFQKNQRESPFVVQAPSWLMGLGILGLLLGIAIGLSQFNVQALEQSIAKLFDGIAMAVITGMGGLSLALLLRWLNAPETQPNQSTRPVTPNDIYQVLKEISHHNVAQKTILSNIVEQTHTHQQNMQKIAKLQQHNSTQVVNLLENLQTKLVNEQENSLLTQFHQLRLIVGEFQTASNNHYLPGNLDEAITGIEQSRDALREIATHTQAIPQTMAQLAQLVHGLNTQLEEMALYLETFQTLRQQAGETFPVLEKNFLDLTKMMQQEMQHHLEWLEMAMETQLDMAEVALEHQLEKVSALQLPLKPKQPSESGVLLASKEQSSAVKAIKSEPENLENNNMEPPIEPPRLESTSPNESEWVLSREEEKRKEEKEEKKPEEKPEEKEEEKKEETTATVNEKNHNAGLIEKLSLAGPDWQEYAYQFMDSGEYDKAIICFQQAIKYAPTDFGSYYNQACCYALVKDSQSALVALQQAINLNKECLKMAQTDSDFDSIRHDTNFQALCNCEL